MDISANYLKSYFSADLVSWQEGMQRGMRSPGCAGWMQNCFARPQLPEVLTDAQPQARLSMLLGENQRELRDLHTVVTPWRRSRPALSGVAMNSPWTIAGQDQLASKCARLDLPAINHAAIVKARIQQRP